MSLSPILFFASFLLFMVRVYIWFESRVVKIAVTEGVSMVLGWWQVGRGDDGSVKGSVVLGLCGDGSVK